MTLAIDAGAYTRHMADRIMNDTRRYEEQASRRPMFTPALSVAKHRPRFLDMPLIPVGMITLIAGRAGVSKSTFSLYKAAQATRGTLAGDWNGNPVHVAISCIEDSKSMVRMRLEAAGADLNRVMFLDISSGTEGTLGGIRIPDDLHDIETALDESDVRLWIIDPITSAMDGDTNKRDDVRRCLDPLAALADRMNIAVVGILHFNKGAGYASDKISGSHAFRDVIRSSIQIAKDDDNGDCVLTLDKSSYTTAQGDSYSYGLMGVDVADDDGNVFSVPKVTGLMPTKRSVNEVINRTQTPPPSEPKERGEALEWLTGYLEEHGATPFRQIADMADERGYTVKQLQRLRERHPGLIASTPDPEHTGRGRGYLWSLTSTDGRG
ncbi:AAA family ATPase [Bifidobacterium leontopitheci]|uniref:Zinc metalloprotease n=1 Tax=Bifidobacterium leontopitheci TaxID=2650774 RepID=A0A6I1GIM2_9BIFI|nr:AAA family ATPase [Bifidobacterium leontopitheci]KAB7790562.1 zinc metalloprotease [Bifidobacterium leontopitheci]